MRVLWVTSKASSAAEDWARERPAEMEVNIAVGALAGLSEMRSGSYDAVLADFPMEGWTPPEWLEEAQRTTALVPVLIRDAGASFHDAVHLTKLGAYYFFGPGAAAADFIQRLEEAAEYRHGREHTLYGRESEQDEWKRWLVGESRPMRDIGHVIRMIGPRRSTVLITGETGTGKEMVARAIHAASPRRHLAMVAVNCNALPESLLEAELFGHVRGAFTGALNQRIGRFEQAHHSTLFLDEIGDMPLALQGKLLRVLQEREFQRLGSSETIRLDVRVIAASNVDLAARMREGKFREDLYYRLNVVPIRVPALRERPVDITRLVYHFIEKLSKQEGAAPKQISREALDRLAAYPWPGNVRQLENAVEMALALSGDAGHLYPSDFPLPSPGQWKPVPVASLQIRLPEDGLDFEQTVSGIERSILGQALERTRGNKKMAAEMLRLKRTTLSAKLKSLEAIAV
jgi:DNA-binding NtrC family response regulator